MIDNDTTDPLDQIRTGLVLVHTGLVRGRAKLERLERETSDLRSGLVAGETHLRAVATQAQRSRMPRHLGAGEVEGTRRLPPANTLPVLVVVSEVDPETQTSLARMGLTRTPHAPGDVRHARLGILYRA